jgi:DNA-binding NarL/FixJ family response regulator
MTAGGTSACGPLLVVDDDELFLAFVCDALASLRHPTRAAASGGAALAAARDEPPRLALIDIRLPDFSGYELCRRLKDEIDERLPVIFVSGERTESFDRVAGLLLGADDYLVKPVAPDELVARVLSVLQRSTPPATSLTAALTNRELEVLRLLADGRSQKEIAGGLVISSKTVGTHIEHILEKLGVRSRSQAIALAFRDGLIDARPGSASRARRDGPSEASG